MYIMLGNVLLSYISPTWNFLTSFYWLFITLSTIGFGDIMPNDDALNSIRLTVNLVADAIKEGKKEAAKNAPETTELNMDQKESKTRRNEGGKHTGGNTHKEAKEAANANQIGSIVQRTVFNNQQRRNDDEGQGETNWFTFTKGK